MVLKRNIIANYVGAVWNALMNVAFVSAYIRYLGASGYGLIGVFMLLIALMTLLDLGMAPTISREMARLQVTPDGGPSARWLLRGAEVVVVCLALAVGILLFAASGWLVDHWLNARGLPREQVVFALRVMALLVALRLGENVYRSTLIGLQRQVLLNAVLALTATLRNVGAYLVLAWYAPTVQAFFEWQLLAGMVTVAAFAAAAYACLPSSGREPFTFAPLRAAWRFAAGAMTVACLAVLLGNLDKVLLSRLLPLDAFGYYALAVVVAQVPLGFVTPIAQAFYPKFTQLWASGDATLAASYHLGSQLVAALLGSATAFLVILGRPVLTLWLHDTHMVDRVEVLVAILSVGSMCNGLMTLPYFLQLAAGWTRLTITMNAFALCIIAPALWLLVPRFGPLAAAWCWLGLNAGYVVVAVPLMHRRLLHGQMARWYLQDIFPPMASACIVAVAWRSVLPMPTGLVGWLWLGAAGATLLAAAVIASPRLRTLVRQRLSF